MIPLNFNLVLLIFATIIVAYIVCGLLLIILGLDLIIEEKGRGQ